MGGVESPGQFIINGNAGGLATENARQSARILIEKDFPGAEVVFTGPATNVAELARQAVERGSRLIVAGGGDGTINAVASALVGTDSVLGVLPLGTLNHFAKDLGIPLDLEASLATLVHGAVKPIDVGEVNGRIFLNNSGLGLYPTVVRLRESKQQEGVGKWPAAIWATLKALARYRILTVRVTVNGKQLERKTPIVFVGNNEYQMQGLGAGHRAQLDAGSLCLYIPRPQSRSDLFFLAIRALIGKAPLDDRMDILLTPEFSLTTRHRHVTISLDGEVTSMEAPLGYRIRSAALRVRLPAPPT